MKFTLICLISCFVFALLYSGDRVAGRMFATRSEVIASHGMAATSQPLATQVAIDVLKRGGNAIDAAIAANASLALMEPTGCGLGGDLFAIVWSSEEQKLFGLNGSGRSPRGLTIDEFRRLELDEIPARGPLPVSVPGAVDGWFELHSRFGRLSIAEVLAPAITYAREGFPVSEIISYGWADAEKIFDDYPNFVETFLPGGRAPRVGEIFKNPDLADTLEKLASSGRDVFYKGEIARTIDQYCRRVGCFLRYEDLAAHSSNWVDPVSTTYRGYEIWELPPNGQGIAVLQILNLLEPYDLSSMGHNSTEYLHHLIEAKKITFEDRAKFYSDPDFNDLPIEVLISKEYARVRRALLDPKKASLELPAGDPKLEKGDTIYLTVADQDRNMVSLIQSNFMGFGSGLVPDGTGFSLQNRGALFKLEDGHYNTYEPGKRPFHTIIPAFVTRNGRPFMSFGVMGGDMQPQGHVQILCNILDFGMNLQEAGDAPRFRHFGSSTTTGTIMTDGGRVALESGIPAQVRRGLLGLGHRLSVVSGGFGGYQAIVYDSENNVYRGASESRKDGMAAGY
jgi:gamma-glutamyltranspeptidase/glutathione hydrolase